MIIINGSFFQNPTFPTVSNEEMRPVEPNNSSYYNMIPTEQITLENFLKINKGKKIKVYSSFDNDTSWKEKNFDGILENTQKDFIIISNPSNGSWYLIKIDNIDYIEFLEKLN